MTRSRRFHVPSIPQHVVQRGHGRQLCFLHEPDYLEYLSRLGAASRKYAVAVHAYVLMTNHVHLLVTPESVGGVASLMQSTGRSYVRWFNAKYGRSGTLWDGRYFSALIGSDSYLWNCHRYIELNPVRAGLVDRPDAYRWSSYGKNAFGTPDPLVTPHPAYLALSDQGERARERYRELFAVALAEAELAEIRETLKHERVFGNPEFLDSIEAISARAPRHRGPGRPWPSPLPEAADS